MKWEKNYSHKHFEGLDSEKKGWERYYGRMRISMNWPICYSIFPNTILIFKGW